MSSRTGTMYIWFNSLFPYLFWILVARDATGFQVDNRPLTWSARAIDPQTVPVNRLLNSFRTSLSRQRDAVPGISYPVYEKINIDTPFYCNDMKGPGYYADPYMQCQQYHRCDDQGRRFTYLCPPGTLFNQVTLVCDFWYNVDCARAKDFAEYSNSRIQLQDVPLFSSSANLADLLKPGLGVTNGTHPSAPHNGTFIFSGIHQSAAGKGVSVGGSASISAGTKFTSQNNAQASASQNTSRTTSGSDSDEEIVGSSSQNDSSVGTLTQSASLDNDRSARLLTLSGQGEATGNMMRKETKAKSFPVDETPEGEEFEGQLIQSQNNGKNVSGASAPVPFGKGPVTSVATYRKDPAPGALPLDQTTDDQPFETMMNSIWESIPNGTESPQFAITTTFGSDIDKPESQTDMNPPLSNALFDVIAGTDRDARRMDTQSPSGSGNNLVLSRSNSHPEGKIVTSSAEYRVSGASSPPKPIITAVANYRGSSNNANFPRTPRKEDSTLATPQSTTRNTTASPYISDIPVMSDTLKVNSLPEPTAMKTDDNSTRIITSEAMYKTGQKPGTNSEIATAMKTNDNSTRIITSESMYKTGQKSGKNSEITTPLVPSAQQNASPVSIHVVTACDQTATVQLEENEIVDAMLTSLKTPHETAPGRTVGVTINAGRSDPSAVDDPFSGKFGTIWDAVPTGSESTTFVTKSLANTDAYFIYESADKPVIIKFAKYNVVVQVRPNPDQ